MSIEISPKNESRLASTAQAHGVSVDAYVEQMLDERDELAAMVEKAAARTSRRSEDEPCRKIERGFLQSERGDVTDGEAFAMGLLVELDELERKQRAG